MPIIVYCFCNTEEDIILSEEDQLHSSFKNLTVEDSIDELCDKFYENLNVKNKFQKVNNSNLIIKFYEEDSCIYLINELNSTMRCHVIDNMFFVFNYSNFEFKKVDSIAKIGNNKIILKLIFDLENNQKYTSSKIHNANEEMLIDNIDEMEYFNMYDNDCNNFY